MPIEDGEEEQISFSPPPMLEREDWQEENEEVEDVKPYENGINGHIESPVVNGHNDDSEDIVEIREIKKEEVDDEQDEEAEESVEDENSSSSGEDTIRYADSDRFSSDNEDYNYRPQRTEAEEKENAERIRRNGPGITERVYREEVEEPDPEDSISIFSDIAVGPDHCPEFKDLLEDEIQDHLQSQGSDSSNILNSEDFHRYDILPTTSTSTSEQGKEKEKILKRERNKSLDITQREWLMLDPYMFDDVYRCFICRDIVQWNIILTCDHVFCTSCLTGEEEHCPKCSSPIDSARHDDLIENLIPRLKLDLIRKQDSRPKPDNPFTPKNIPLYATLEQQEACSSRRGPEPLCLYSLPHVKLIELSDEEMEDIDGLDYRELLKRPRISRRNINSKFDHRFILKLSKLGCPVILRPRKIKVNVRRKTMHLILPETSYIGHLEEYVKRWIRNEMSFKGLLKMQISFRRIKYSKMKKDVKIINKRKVELQSPGKCREPMTVYCQKIGEPRLHNRWTLNQYRIYNKINQTSPLEFTYDIKPLSQRKTVKK